ncbi:MAG: helicase-associated domain-containing protein [Anaerolineae bacterium]|nr:helicase-associated domain-containing protein [Anaerolineae bacterium]
MPLLRQCLLDTYLVRLRAIARFWNVELTATRQREAAFELEEAMSDPEAVTRAYETLPDQEREALNTLLISGGEMPERVFARKGGQIRTMGPGRMDRERPWEEPVSPAEGLWYHGFLFRSFEQGPDGAYGAVLVPPEIRAHLPTPDAEHPRVTLQSVPEPPVIHPASDLFLDDACTLLAYLQNERPRTTPDREWSDSHTKRLLRRLRDPDQERFAFLTHLAYSMGWVTDQEGGPLRLEPESVTTWLQADAFHQRRTIAEAWQDDALWNDLFHVPSLQPEDTGAWHNDPVIARHAILHHLESCVPERWYTLDEFIAAIKDADPDFQRPRGDYETWYIRDGETGAYLSGFENWDAVEGRVIRHLITRPLAWLGLVDLGAHRRDQPATAFRLTRDGAAILELAEPPSPSERATPRLRPGFLVSVPAGRRYERFQLSRVADWVESDDRYAYRLTPDSLTRAREQGIPVTRVVEFLDEVTEAPLPRSVEAALTRWDTSGTEAWVQRSVLLRLSSEEMMNKAMASPRVSRLIQEQIGPTIALVRERDWPLVAAGLEEIGLLPQINGLTTSHDGEQADRPSSTH